MTVAIIMGAVLISGAIFELVRSVRECSDELHRMATSINTLAVKEREIHE